MEPRVDVVYVVITYMVIFTAFAFFLTWINMSQQTRSLERLEKENREIRTDYYSLRSEITQVKYRIKD